AGALGGEQRVGIEARQSPERGAVAEQSGVEEVRRQSPGLGAELAEPQDAGLHGEPDKLRAQIVGQRFTPLRTDSLDAMIRVVTLNLNGIRSAARKGWLEWAAAQRADVLCVQEIKAQDADLDDSLRTVGGMQGRFHFAGKKGYSGVGVY